MSIQIFKCQEFFVCFSQEAGRAIHRPGPTNKALAIGLFLANHYASLQLGVFELARSVWRAPRRLARAAIAPLRHDGYTVHGFRRAVSGVARVVALTALRIFCFGLGLILPEVVFNWLRLHEKLLRLGLYHRIQNIYISKAPDGGVFGCEDRVFTRLITEAVAAPDVSISASMEERIRQRVFQELVEHITPRLERLPFGRSVKPILEEILLRALRSELGIEAPQAQPQPTPPLALPFAERSEGADPNTPIELIRAFLSQPAILQLVAMIVEHQGPQGGLMQFLAQLLGAPIPPDLRAFQGRLLDAIREEAKAVYDTQLYSADEVRDGITALQAIINRAVLKVVKENAQIMANALAAVAAWSVNDADFANLIRCSQDLSSLKELLRAPSDEEQELPPSHEKQELPLSHEEQELLPYYLCVDLERCRKVRSDLPDLDSSSNMGKCFLKLGTLVTKFVNYNLPREFGEALALPDVPEEENPPIA